MSPSEQGVPLSKWQITLLFWASVSLSIYFRNNSALLGFLNFEWMQECDSLKGLTNFNRYSFWRASANDCIILFCCKMFRCVSTKVMSTLLYRFHVAEKKFYKLIKSCKAVTLWIIELRHQPKIALERFMGLKNNAKVHFIEKLCHFGLLKNVHLTLKRGWLRKHPSIN